MRRLRPRAAVLLALSAAVACGRGDISSPDPERRARAVRSSDDPEDSVAILLVAERDPSPLVRLAAAEAYTARAGPGAADALGKLLVDRAPDVACAAARGLASMTKEPRARVHLVAAYADATPAARAAIADALERMGVSPREAVEQEARILWERHIAALEAGHGASRAGAAEELGASSRTDAVQRLLPLVDPNRNGDAALAAAAARGLAESGDWTSRPFIEALLDVENASLAEAAAVALGRLGDPAAADALAAAAVSRGGTVAAAAGEALAALPDASEVGVALCELAIRTDVPAVARHAARAARQREAECPERPLLAKLGGPGAESALTALAELRLAPGAAGASAERVAALLDAGRAPDAAVRAAAATALARIGTTAAAAAVARRLGSVLTRVSERRARWIEIPPRAGAPPEWIDAVTAGDARELGALLAAAGRLRIAEAEGLVLPRTRDPAAAVRAGALEGLSALGSPRGFEAVAEALADPDAGVRLAAAEALARYGARGAKALMRAADAATPGTSREWTDALARAMGATGSADAIPALARLLDGPSASEAAAAIAHLGAPGAVPALVEYVGRPEAPARAAAIDALAQLVARDAGPSMAALLTDDRPEVRAEAARGLGRLGHEAASGRLEALRSDYYGRVRRAAVDALAKLPTGGARARP